MDKKMDTSKSPLENDMKGKGRPRKTETELPDPIANAIFRTLDHYRNNFESKPISLQKIEERLKAAGRRLFPRQASAEYCIEINGLEFNIEPDFSIGTSSLSNYFSVSKITNKRVAIAIYLWMKSDYGNILKTHESLEYFRVSEKEVFALRSLFKKEDTLGLPKISSFVGKYALYRADHLKPDSQISVCRLVVGGKDPDTGETSDFNCLYESIFLSNGEEYPTTATGKLVPSSETQAVAILTTKGGEVFSLHIDESERPGYEAKSLAGIVTAMAAKHISAWPFFAKRSSGDFKIGPVDSSVLTTLSAQAQERLSRGNIYWKHSDFPGFGLAKAKEKAVSEHVASAASANIPQPK